MGDPVRGTFRLQRLKNTLSDGERLITDADMHYTLIGAGARTKLRAFVGRSAEKSVPNG
ncbi:hypothetical protein AB0O22_19270 [Streptomyces sp. NPDC091204]|uniref:hypothetical protein n=1 Tax=Streptomyces sp. NPDC091204 TaxID=3155299 RepID=UPI003430AA20